jgi:hypothetical protein
MHYYVYKNGKGNCWADFSREHGHLYVGYDGTCDKLVAEAGFHPIPIVQQEDKHLADFQDDLLHIMVAAHVDNHARFLLLTFEEDVVCFWRARGEVQRHEHESDVWRTAKKYADQSSVMGGYAYFNETRAPLPWDQQRTFADLRLKERAFRTLPVELVDQVERHRLYTSIDSLSVYQYLNRGTCRPFWRISGPTGANIPEEIQPSGPTATYLSGGLAAETRFAAFARLYLNEILVRRVPQKVPANLPHLGALRNLDYRALALATFNPILVETAALALVADLGLTPDIGVGKGMDVIDVRARAATPDGRLDPALAERALHRLRATGVNASPKLTGTLLDHGVLDIQCKAAHRDHVSEGILYFGFQREDKCNRETDTLLVPALQAALDREPFADPGSALRRFVAMQAEVLRGAWWR